MDSTKLLRVNEEKDLGVIITENLSWESHLTCICAKANKLLGLLKRTCISIIDRSVRKTLYLALVKSNLSYATEVWSPASSLLKQKAVRRFRDVLRDGSCASKPVKYPTKRDFSNWLCSLLRTIARSKT